MAKKIELCEGEKIITMSNYGGDGVELYLSVLTNRGRVLSWQPVGSTYDWVDMTPPETDKWRGAL